MTSYVCQCGIEQDGSTRECPTCHIVSPDVLLEIRNIASGITERPSLFCEYLMERAHQFGDIQSAYDIFRDFADRKGSIYLERLQKEFPTFDYDDERSAPRKITKVVCFMEQYEYGRKSEILFPIASFHGGFHCVDWCRESNTTCESGNERNHGYYKNIVGS